MANAAEAPWKMIIRQVRDDLQPFDGRFALTWRVALLCAIVAGAAMMHRIPESAISCYLIIFLMRPNGAECVGKAIGLIILATILVLGMAPLIQALADAPLLRIAVIAGASFVFLFLSSASQMGEIGAIIGLVIAFILTMVDLVPAGEIVTRGLLYAWAMACMPMALMVGFSLILGTGPHTLLRKTVAERLETSAGVLEGDDLKDAKALMGEGQAEVDTRVMMTRAFHTASRKEADWLAGAAASTYALMLAAAALPASVGETVRRELAAKARAAAEAVRAGGRPPADDAAGSAPDDQPLALATVNDVLAGLSRDNGGVDAKPGKVPFLAPDAFTNPDHQTYALKTTAAAVMAYLTYSLMDWEGIATAMVTCYVAALGSTGETVHKLTLRIVGCLIGAAIGILSILFVIPHLTSVGGLMALVFCAILPAAWVSTGSERISYGGVQIGLAFLLTILNGFSPSIDMDSARDRIIGILLGNTLVFIMFTNFWPKSASVEVRRQLAKALTALARIAESPSDGRTMAVNDISDVAASTAVAKMALDMTPFEPRSQKPDADEILRLYALIDEIEAVLPSVVYAHGPLDDAAGHLRRASAALDPDSDGPDADDAPMNIAAADVAEHTRRIGQLAAG